jgi:molybdopterin/thiamine biosynthesis adenylyltransferase
MMVDRALSDHDANRYARQLVLLDIGWEGQQKLKRSTVLVVGAGGLGSPILVQLVSMGVGHIRIVDRDIVSGTDLQRQYLFREPDVGRPKVEGALPRLKEINPSVEMEGYAESLTYEGILKHMKGVDVVLDGLDGIRARYMINRAALETGVPYVFSSAIEMLGCVTTIVPGKTPCLECFYGGLQEGSVASCAVIGVHPAILGVVGSIAVSEAIKIITGAEPSLMSKLLMVDLRNFSFDLVTIKNNPSCHVSGKHRKPTKVPPLLLEHSCKRDGTGTFFINPKRVLSLDLSKLDSYCGREGIPVLRGSSLFRTLRLDDFFDVSILKSGTAIFAVKQPLGDIRAGERRMKSLCRDIVGKGLGIGWDQYGYPRLKRRASDAAASLRPRSVLLAAEEL